MSDRDVIHTIKPGHPFDKITIEKREVYDIWAYYTDERKEPYLLGTINNKTMARIMLADIDAAQIVE